MSHGEAKTYRATRGGSVEEMSRACDHRLVLLFTVLHSFVVVMNSWLCRNSGLLCRIFLLIIKSGYTCLPSLRVLSFSLAVLVYDFKY